MLYFAYGSNMDLEAMALRCPRSRRLGLARLMGHRFYLMGQTGYASVRRDPQSVVEGVLFELAPADLPELDIYEDVAEGLYTKAQRSVLPVGSDPRCALVYFGSDESEGGVPPIGYMENVLIAARKAALSRTYLANLEALVSRGGT